MSGHAALADAARRRVILADVPKRRLNADGVAEALGAAEAVPAPPGGGSPVHWYAVRRAVLPAMPSTNGPDQH
jgi:hypothetical protein